MELHECLEPEDVVVEAVGKLEGGTRALERRRESLPEAFRPGEADVDARLERRLRRRLAQRLRENGNGEVVVLELGEEKQGLGAQRAALRLGQQIVGDRSRARPLPCSEMRTSRSERPPVALVARVRRRQPERVLGELGRERRRAAIGRETRGVVEHGGDAGVRRLRRQREVTGAEERVVDDAPQPARERRAAPRRGPGREPTTAEGA